MTANLFLVYALIVLLIFTSTVEGRIQTAIARTAKVNNNLDFFNPLLPIPPMHPVEPPNKSPSVPEGQIASGLDLPKNLIVPTPNCVKQPNASSISSGGSSPVSSISSGGSSPVSSISSGGSSPVSSVDTIMNNNHKSGCPVIKGTKEPDIIIATATSSPIIYGLDGNDVIQCGSGNCKVYGGPGDNIMMSSSSSSAQLYGASGNNVFIGSGGDTLMVGGKGNDQFYAGSGHDVMIGGGGANYFDCGSSGNGVIIDFNAKNGDTKAPNCKFVITVNTGVPSLP